ncbi:MAG: hypothetical protein GZ088_15935 [Acidipila sp.]|nr:hypothetical protein [Acidipila sp.]
MVEDASKQGIPEGWVTVDFNKKKWAQLKAACANAVKTHAASFAFGGNLYDTRFTKYFIEHHDHRFK